MDDVYDIIAIAAFIVLMGLWTALRLHKERPFSMLAVLLAGGGPVAALDAARRCGRPGATASDAAPRLAAEHSIPSVPHVWGCFRPPATSGGPGASL